MRQMSEGRERKGQSGEGKRSLPRAGDQGRPFVCFVFPEVPITWVEPIPPTGSFSLLLPSCAVLPLQLQCIVCLG